MKRKPIKKAAGKVLDSVQEFIFDSDSPVRGKVADVVTDAAIDFLNPLSIVYGGVFGCLCIVICSWLFNINYTGAYNPSLKNWVFSFALGMSCGCVMRSLPIMFLAYVSFAVLFYVPLMLGIASSIIPLWVMVIVILVGFAVLMNIYQKR